MIPSAIQGAVDQYIELYQVSKQLEQRMKELREQITTFMQANGIEQIRDGSGTGKVTLNVLERPVLTARYTTYDRDELSELLDPSLLEKCLVEVVDKEKVEALSKLGEISDDVMGRKSTKPSVQLSVRVIR